LHYHYQWMYAIILFYLLIFYFGMIKDFYMVACFFITLAVLSFTALNSPASTYLVQLLTDRFFYTVLAVLLIIFCELLIFPRAGQVGDKIASAFHNVCELYPSLLRNILCHYKDDQMLSEETVLMIQNLLKGYDDLKTKYFSQFYELRYSKENNDLYQRFFNFFDRVSVITSRLLAITTHSHEPIKSTRIKTALLKIIDILDDAFQSMKSPTLITQKRAYERDITQVTESLKESEKNNLALLLLLTCCEEIAAEIDQESAIK